MSERTFRAGDRVTATGTVENANPHWLALGYVTVRFDGYAFACGIPARALTLITPAEPPVGSVVVKDGVAWLRYKSGWHAYGLSDGRWDDISDGDIIFTPGGNDGS